MLFSTYSMRKAYYWAKSLSKIIVGVLFLLSFIDKWQNLKWIAADNDGKENSGVESSRTIEKMFIRRFDIDKKRQLISSSLSPLIHLLIYKSPCILKLRSYAFVSGIEVVVKTTKAGSRDRDIPRKEQLTESLCESTARCDTIIFLIGFLWRSSPRQIETKRMTFHYHSFPLGSIEMKSPFPNTRCHSLDDSIQANYTETSHDTVQKLWTTQA